MSFRSGWENNAVFTECPACRHLGPHLPDELGMLRCDVCATTFAPAPADAPPGETGSYVDTPPRDAIDVSWIPRPPEAG